MFAEVRQTHAGEHRVTETYSKNARRMLTAAMETTGPMVEICLRYARQGRRRSNRDKAAELAVTFAKQGLRAARMLYLYPDRPDED